MPDNNKRSGLWPAERQDRVRQLLNTMPTAEIARRIGITKNAVIGWLYRQGLHNEPLGGPKRTPAPPTSAEFKPVLTDADWRGCLWISGEPVPLRPGLLCGQRRRDGSVYCEPHHRLSRVPPAPPSSAEVVQLAQFRDAPS